MITLCGYLDSCGESALVTSKPDCPVCIAIVRHCKKIRL